VKAVSAAKTSVYVHLAWRDIDAKRAYGLV
jgi:hypothetical protein